MSWYTITILLLLTLHQIDAAGQREEMARVLGQSRTKRSFFIAEGILGLLRRNMFNGGYLSILYSSYSKEPIGVVKETRPKIALIWESWPRPTIAAESTIIALIHLRPLIHSTMATRLTRFIRCHIANAISCNLSSFMSSF